jgi:drug/metabolite transporter (DMT)-like permease
MTIPHTQARTGLNKSILLLLAGVLLFSCSASSVAIANVGPIAAAFYRMWFAAMILCAVLVFQRKWQAGGLMSFVWPAASGIFLAIDLMLWHESIKIIGPGLGSVLTNFQIFFLMLFGIFFFKERPGWPFYLAMPLAIFGLTLVVGVDWSSTTESYKTGVALGFLSGLGYAASVLCLKQSQSHATKMPPMQNMACLCLMASAFLFLASRWYGESLVIPDRVTLGSLLIYGILVQVVGWLIVSRALPHVSAAVAGLVFLIEPVLTVILDNAFFGLQLSWLRVAGIALTLSMVYIGSNAIQPGRAAAGSQT